MAINSIKNTSNQLSEITWNSLYSADSNFAVPFKIFLQDDVIFCEEIIRILPGKRIVAFGIWKERRIVAKIFFAPRQAKRHFKRELIGHQTLQEAHIPTPNVLLKKSDAKEKLFVILFERIDDAENLEDSWLNKNDIDDCLEILQKVTIELATQHVLGVVQKDLHLKNFLTTEKLIYSLDGGSVENYEVILPRKESLEHLALFFSQLGVGTEELQKNLFETYTHARGWIVKSSDLQFLKNTTKKFNKQRWINYDKKVLRDCTAFKKITNITSLIMYDRGYESREFFAFLNNPDVFFNDPDAIFLKKGRSSTVAKIFIDNKPYVLKRYNLKNTFHRLRRCLRPSRAVKSWRLSNLLRLFGVVVPKPIAFVEKRMLGLRGKSFFLMEYVDGMELGDFLTSEKNSAETKKLVAKRVALLIKNLAKLNISHGDLKMTNILISNERPFLLDLDGMTEHHPKQNIQRIFKNETKRFLKNWEMRPAIKNLFEEFLETS